MVDDPGRPGNWVALPENGLGALMAFAAGPGYARPRSGVVPRPVRVTLERPGRPPISWEEERTPEDDAVILESIVSYLAEAGITAAAPVTAWEILLPEGVTGADLERRTGAAMAEVPVRRGPLTQAEVDAVVHAVQDVVSP
ncbi:DUF5956 domain-containing protein [Occultella aeris]|uniref:Uncharacterized protein n=2 Tax=Occultella aeris TaxID=2761496 RepID=A0A7M4DQG1_9MICO|nr:hypothetical protein HALOF300_04399 [Occultella aeris]